MATVEQKFHSYLCASGMFPEGADEVMAAFKPEVEKLVPDYRITWDRPAEEYPLQVYVLWGMELDRQALKWIDANCPKAWYRSLFAEEPTDVK